MKKLLILKEDISSYNVPIYNKIAERYDLTVGFFRKNNAKDAVFYKTIMLKYKKVGPFYIINNIHQICDKFDVVSFVPDFHALNICTLPFIPHKYKLINWSIGFRVSYDHPYLVDRKHNCLDWLFLSILKKCDASIFYMEKSKEFWKDSSLDMSKIFVAPNTTAVTPIEYTQSEKNNILFVGTLYKGKGLNLLLESFKKAVEITKSSKKLVIVGEGEMREYILNYIKNNGLKNQIVLTGAIYNEKELAEEFRKALLCVSPLQAGLSVPKSMGYGVPFVTRKDAITGGEIYHICNGENGIMYNKNSDLTDILVEAMTTPTKYYEMGLNAKKYYENKASICHMVQGAINAFDFAINH